MTDRVYLDTGDVLVTARRVAFEGVSVPLAEVDAARVETAREWMPRKPCGRRFHPAIVVVCNLVGFGLVGAFFYYCWSWLPSPLPVSPFTKWLLPILVVDMGLVCAIAVVIRRRSPPAPPRLVTWHAVMLTVRGRDVALFRTRDLADAAPMVEAVNRAIADREPGGRPAARRGPAAVGAPCRRPG